MGEITTASSGSEKSRLKRLSAALDRFKLTIITTIALIRFCCARCREVRRLVRSASGSHGNGIGIVHGLPDMESNQSMS